jgi:hypothetical protein
VAKFSVEELSKLAAQMDERTFVSRFPEPALILATPGIDTDDKKFDTPEAGVPTEKFFGRTSTFDAGAYRVLPKSLSETHDEDASATQPKALKLLGKSEVVFLKKTDRNPFANMVTLGRARNNDLILPLPTISKVHAIFTRAPTGWTVTDQRSTNGIVVDDSQLQPGAWAPVNDGSVVRLGPVVTMKFFTPSGLFGFLSLFRSGIAS